MNPSASNILDITASRWKALLPSSCSPPQHDGRSILGWWERRRLACNAIVGGAGLVLLPTLIAGFDWMRRVLLWLF